MVAANEGPRNYSFVKYNRAVLPIDGSVFWVKTGTITKKVKGSLHYATEMDQRQEETISINRVMFNSEEEIQEFNEVGPTTIYVGQFEDIRFAFSSRDNWYVQAGIYHYLGSAIYSDMETQLVNDASQLPTDAVVSNSLPIWLSMNGAVMMPFPLGSGGPLPLFPSFLATTNLPPPFATVHVAETTALQSAPRLDSDGSHWQLVRDRVQITTFGARNNQIMDLVDFVNKFMLDNDSLGLMNMPVVRDEKRTQVELGVIAQKKTIDYEVSYYQARARATALQLIMQASEQFAVQD